MEWRGSEAQVLYLSTELGPRWSGCRRGTGGARARHRRRCGAATVSRCRGASLVAWRRAELARVGDGHGVLWAVLDVHGAAQFLRMRVPAGRSAALRGCRGVRKRGGGTMLSYHGVATSGATVPTMATCVRGCCPLAFLLVPDPFLRLLRARRGERKRMEA